MASFGPVLNIDFVQVFGARVLTLEFRRSIRYAAIILPSIAAEGTLLKVLRAD